MKRLGKCLLLGLLLALFVITTAPVATAQGPVAQTTYVVYPPYGQPTVTVQKPVARLDTLEGKTICGVGNSFHFEETFPVIAGLLAKKYPTAKFIGPDVFNKIGGGTTDGILAALPAAAKENKCDAFIVGNGC